MEHQAHFCIEVNYKKGNDEEPFFFNLNVDDSSFKHMTPLVVYEVIKDNGYQREFDSADLDLFIQEAKKLGVSEIKFESGGVEKDIPIK
ncbi:hypothetical protein ETN89_12925 [Photobacterium damselae subsp. damselae]|uniref:Uncharacterized protein n=1 Tax=Photobacterium damselae TaxID=38293 RepID=A0A2T3QBC8_PHODM|nr:hypothetical protein [Photobacterium damselae]ARR49319.1 hypothetical protein CAY62_06850 [Photobacterium damselae subsp. damselae]PSW81505.1 hypothetical protein CTN07_18905 [Photobacterium damselae]QAY36132.1 hypothetical protein ETN89_12925 [Photobacterium damselae subsp. damselae]SPY28308.1 Uncharacterised protein [Photobacterium damselae]